MIAWKPCRCQNPVAGLLGLVNDPYIPEAYVLTVFLKFETFRRWADFDTPISVLDGYVVVNFDSIPPYGRTGGFDSFISVPFGSFENKVKRLPLAVGSPSVYIWHALHTEGSDAMWSDLPIVGIVHVFAFG